MMVQNNIKKIIFAEINSFKEIKKFHWANVPIVQETKNAAKNQAVFLFLKNSQSFDGVKENID